MSDEFPSGDFSMPPELPAPRRKTLWAKILASKFLVVSIAVHLLFGAGAAVYVVQRYQSNRKLTFKSGPPSTNPNKRAMEHKVSMAKKKNSMSAPAQAKRITTSGLSKVALPERPAMPTATTVTANRMAGMGGFGTGIGPPGGTGSGGMGGGGGGSGVNFFGLRSQVKTIVFVFDVSGSMIMGNKSAASYEKVEDEIIKVIQSLTPGTKFGLVGFAKEADAYRQEPVDARQEEKANAISWLKSMNPAGALRGLKPGEKPSFKEYKNGRHQGTRADLGLERAFKMKPDTIFFVSDGEPSGTTPAEVYKQVEEAQRNLTKPATVNAVAFLADSGQKFMKALAEKNQGVFREVNPGEKAKDEAVKK